MNSTHNHRSRGTLLIFGILLMLLLAGMVYWVLSTPGSGPAGEDKSNTVEKLPVREPESQPAPHRMLAQTDAVEEPARDKEAESEPVQENEIRGRVVFESRGVPRVRVLAVESGWNGPLEDVERALGAGGGQTGALRVSQSGEEGNFTLANLEPGRQYTLHAGGGGFALSQALQQVKTGTGDVELHVLPVYGLVVNVVSADGSPLQCNPDLAGRPFAHTGAPQGEGVQVRPAPSTGLAAMLWGVPRSIAENRVENPKLIAYCGRDESDMLKSVQFHLKRPGYAAVDRVYDLPRVQNTLEQRVERVAMEAPGFARVRVQVEGLRLSDVLPTDRHAVGNPAGSLQFRTKNSSGFDYDLWDATKTTLDIDGIPLGEYQVSFAAAEGFHRGRVISVTLTKPEELLQLDVREESAPEPASLELHVYSADGSVYDGFVTVSLANGPANRTGIVHFNRGPYVLEHLPPQLIQFTVIPETVRKNGEPPEYLKSTVTLSPGVQSRVDLTMKKR